MKKLVLSSIMTLALIVPATSGFAAAQSYPISGVTKTIYSNQTCAQTISYNDGRGYIGNLTNYSSSKYGDEKTCYYAGTMYYQY